ncbi:peptide-methionine (S)-S-oxide reductase [Zeaxanthinibacter sp. PT1]|uniref:peptide-methionine (S)-S-oxide reductase n=1 Tax=Zeaxanthinibacter TaxID=561554 RepID=UPI00234A0BDA|nr:peptide-methionine (S)-S-oxide reductase [Zeaxanthinibacter sp. PT1]MDC6350775.1 peptide-methionine (S)-S-oxide reductase [Zeaxanthinibacter sp. PT1]
MIQIGLGGGCHWCTEAVFQSLKGVLRVKQGWISARETPAYSEAVIVCFDPESISLKDLVEVHLRTHSSTSQHFLRNKYRSAVYTFSEIQQQEVLVLLGEFDKSFEKSLITIALSFADFKENSEEFRQYYARDPGKPFCKNYIDPKLQLLLKKFNKLVDPNKLKLSALPD